MCARNETLVKRLQKREELKAKVAKLNQELDEIDKYLKGQMNDRGLDELTLFDEDRVYKMSYKSINKNSFDTKKFKKDNPDMYEKYLNESSYKRFVVS